jgi:hypothetical protein
VDGLVIVGTFSVDGPIKCSGLDIQAYDEDGMKAKFEKSDFKKFGVPARRSYYPYWGSLKLCILQLYETIINPKAKMTWRRARN